MVERVLGLAWRGWRGALAAVGWGLCAATNAAIISVGSYPEPNPVPSIAVPPDAFLVPVQISGATDLQNWQFSLLFDNSVVEEVDPYDGSSGIYGAEFVPGSPETVSFILGGFPSNALGLVDGVAGSYPSLLTGPSGDGVLAYVLFRFLDGQETRNPGFAIDGGDIGRQVPEPSTLALLSGVVGLLVVRRRHANTAAREVLALLRPRSGL